MRTSLAILLATATCVGSACTDTPSPASPTPPPPTTPSSPTPEAVAAPVSTATTESTAPSPAPKAPEPAPPVAVLPFERMLDGPARSLALGKQGRAAVLKDQPWRYDGEKWQEVPLPAALQKPATATEIVQIYFGRDNRMRLMGRRTEGGETGFVYLRFKNGWREGHREIGALANKPHRGLFGILGWDDPEVVCKMDDICIIKRLTGWTIIKSGPGTPEVVIAQQSAWALHADHIAEVTNTGWRKLDAIPFQSPRGLWADATKKLWVSAADSMFHHDGSSWVRHASPVSRPQAVWGTAPNDVWVAGDDGAGHFDGKTWRKVAGVTGPLSFVLGRDGDVWLAGAAGVWRGRAKP